jgi:hypothetical protein
VLGEREVVTLVGGNARAGSFHFDSVSAANLPPLVKERIEQGARLTTDDSGLYEGTRDHFGSRDIVKRSGGEYSRREGAKIVHANTVEGTPPF